MSTATARAYRSNFADRFMPSGRRTSPEIKPFHGYPSTYLRKAHCIKDRVLLDPSMGSAHFGVYAFEVLEKIYTEYGFNEREAAASIVQNNLFGLDIDDRSAQIAYFAIMMKAMQYDKRFLRRGIQPHFYSIQESNDIDSYTIDYFAKGDAGLKKDIKSIVADLKDAKEYGSILQIAPVDFASLYARFEEIKSGADISMYTQITLDKLLPLVEVAEVMSRKYAVVATNPPYMNKYDAKLKKYITDNYSDYKGDLFSVFMYRNFGFCKQNGYSGFMTPMVWMFIKSYELLRNMVIGSKHITTLIQFEYSAFEEATVPICSFVLQNKKSDEKGYYFRLSDFKGGMEVQKQKVLEAQKSKDCGYYFESTQSNFSKIPGSPVAYWASETMLASFSSSKTLKDIAEPRQGLATADNNRFLRLWYEVLRNKVGLGYGSIESAKESGLKWFPYNKGGEFRKWYGNNEYLVNWENDGFEIRNFGDGTGYIRSRAQNTQFYFRQSITWSFVSSSYFGVRFSPEGALFDVGGSSVFPPDELKYYLTGFLCSKLSSTYMIIQNPTMNFQVGNVATLPIIEDEGKKTQVDEIVMENIQLSKDDWDSFETSWDFKRHPLLNNVYIYPVISRAQNWKYDGSGKAVFSNTVVKTQTWALESVTADKFTRISGEVSISIAFNTWKQECENRFQTLKANEEELNRIFIDIYGLQDELTPEVEDKDVTVYRIFDSKAEIPDSMAGSRYALTKQDVIKSFISYAVGCIFGRYSLDVEGLAYAGGQWDASKYQTFPADKDGILPICDDEYFDDDITGLFVKFVETVYGNDTLEENLKFIADALGGSGSPREVIRNYFLNDFFKDHCKIYQKRPIYWLFDSGKKNGFKCLIYMHRYQPDTIARIRTDYVHEQQARYRTAIEGLDRQLTDASTPERVKINKQLTKLKDQAEETRIFEEKIHHLADQMIKIDLDDGVKHNYEIFKDVLAKIK